jgi:hypothetical protein
LHNFLIYAILDPPNNMTSDYLLSKLDKVTPSQKMNIEAWVVNSVKLNMIVKMDKMLERQGRENLRKLFLVPIFSISEIEKRVKEHAPELKTIFYKELSKTITHIENIVVK